VVVHVTFGSAWTVFVQEGVVVGAVDVGGEKRRVARLRRAGERNIFGGKGVEEEAFWSGKGFVTILKTNTWR
jgi:hypothetical protein